MTDVYDLSDVKSSLNRLDARLQNVDNHIDQINSEVNKVQNNVTIVQSDVKSLTRDFMDFIKVSENRYNLTLAETRIIKINQELDKKFGHYDEVRRMTTGILQATDLGIIRGETMTSLTEEVTLKAPGYWLAPSLLALTAWINDQPEIAKKALDAALKRDDEKTSLLFALICRRGNRYETSLKWLRRYIGNQEPEQLDRKFIIVLDAYVNGLLGGDSEGEVYSKLAEWLEHIVEQTDFVPKQRKLWGSAIESMKRPVDESDWKYSKDYSHTWPQMRATLEYVEVHGKLKKMFQNIFDTPVDRDSLKAKLDGILDDLVTNYDSEEMPLRQDLRLNELIIEFNGDVDRANGTMDSEKTAFEETKDFASLLTEVSMNPGLSGCSISLQKYAISLCKEWIIDAYRDTCAKNRANIPQRIEINVDTFNSQTYDGSDEEKIIADFDQLIDSEMQEALVRINLSAFDWFCLGGGAGIAALAAIMAATGSALVGGIGIIVGLGLVLRWWSNKSKLESRRTNVKNQFEQKRTSGKEIIRALIAEIVDFRRIVKKKDETSEGVEKFLEDVKPDQFVQKLAESVRKIDTTKPGVQVKKDQPAEEQKEVKE